MPVILYFASIVLTCALSGFLAVFAWRQRSVPGSRAYAGLALGECLLALVEILSMLSSTPAQALFWFQVRYLTLAVIPVFWLVFALEYSGRHDWLSKRLLAGMFVIPVITQVLLWSNSLLGLWARQEVGFHQTGLFWIAETSARIPGIGFLTHSLYALILLLVGNVLLVITAWRMRRQFLGQALLLASAGFTAFVFAFNSVFNLIPQIEFNLFTPGIGLSVLLIALAVFRFQFLKRAPAASADAVALQAQSNRSLGVFLIIFVIMTAGITATGYVSYQDYEQRFRHQVESQLSSIAALKVEELQSWRKERMGDAGLVYQNSAFSALVQRYLEDPSDAQAQVELQTWLERYQVYRQYSRVFLLDTRGVERLSAPATPEPVAAHLTQEATAILNAGQVTFLDFYRDTADGPIHLSLLVPIYAPQGNRPLGILVLRIDPSVYLYPYIQQWPVPSTSAETLLIRRDGADVLYLNELKFQANAALNLRVPLKNVAVPAARAVLGQEGIVEGTDYRGAPVIADMRPVPGSPWFLVARVDIAEVYAPLQERLWQTAILFGALIAACGAALGLVWWQQRLRYYREQAESAEALRESEIKFSKAFQTSPYAITITRAEDGAFIDVNEAFTSMTGFTRAEAFASSSVGLKLWVNEEERQRVVAALRAGDAVVGKEYLFRTKSGKVITGLFAAQVILLSHEHCILSSINDITERKWAEEALRESENKYRVLFEMFPVGVTVADKDGKILESNGMADRLLGISKEEQERRAIDGVEWKIIRPDGSLMSSEEYASVRALRENRLIENVEMGIVKGKNWVTWINVTATPFVAGSVVITYHDITERKRAEEALRETQELLTNVLEHATVSIYVTGTDGRLALVNRAWEQDTGMRREAVIGRSLAEVFAPEIARKLDGDNQSVLTTGTPLITEESLPTATEPHHFFTTKFPLRDSQGRAVAVGGVSLDITERKRAEEALRESEGRFREIFENISSGAVVYEAVNGGADFKINHFNRAAEKIESISRASVIGRTVCEAFPGVKALGLFDIFQRVWQTGNPEHFPVSFYQDGRIAGWRENYVARLPSGEVVVVYDDVTERKRQETDILAAQAELQRLFAEADRSRRALLGVVEDQKIAEEEIRRLNAELEQRVRDRTAQLQSANNELEAFAYSVSHDLRAPLRALNGFSAALLSDYAAQVDVQGKHYLDRIQEASRRMGQLIEDLLNLSRVTRSELTHRPVDLSVLAREIAAELQARDPQRQVEFVIANGIIVQGDAPLLRIALENLMNNAWKFASTRPQARVEIGAIERDGAHAVFVRDNGVGFDMTYADKLFAPFQRLHGANEFPGTGIGLATVQRIVHRHGGRVWVEAAVDQGATFYFTLEAYNE